MLNRFFASGSHDYLAIYEILAGSSLRSVPLVLMGSSDRMNTIVERAETKGVVHPILDYLRAARAMSERDYQQAGLHLDSAMERDPQNGSLARYRILANVLAGRRDEALHWAWSLRARNASRSSRAFAAWLDQVARENLPPRRP